MLRQRTIHFRLDWGQTRRGEILLENYFFIKTKPKSSPLSILPRPCDLSPQLVHLADECQSRTALWSSKRESKNLN
jgi:hypothetical protein